MKHGILLASLLWTLSVTAQQPQPSDAAVADDYCEAVIQKWDLLFQWARDAAPDIETGLADLDAYAERGRRLVDTSLYSYKARFLCRRDSEESAPGRLDQRPCRSLNVKPSAGRESERIRTDFLPGVHAG